MSGGVGGPVSDVLGVGLCNEVQCIMQLCWRVVNILSTVFRDEQFVAHQLRIPSAVIDFSSMLDRFDSLNVCLL